MTVLLEIISEKITNICSSVAQDTAGATMLILVHFAIFMVGSFCVDRLKLDLPKSKICSLKNKVYCLLYATIIVCSAIREFIVQKEDTMSYSRTWLYRFVIAYHPFHLVVLRRYGLINKCFIYHHIGAMFLAYSALYMGRSNLLGVCYVLAEYNHLLYQVRMILRDAIGKQLPKACDVATFIHIVNFIACRGIAWPIVVISAGINGYPLVICFVCMGFWLYFLSNIFGEMRPILKRTLCNLNWGKTEIIAKMQ